MDDNKIKWGTDEWYLYHHIKNEKPIIPLILLTYFLAICNGGIWWIILIWGWYFHWAHKSNEELDNDIYILFKRELMRQSREKRNQNKK